MDKIILSIDPGNKCLGILVARVDNKNDITVLFAEKRDILSGLVLSETKLIERSRLLKAYLVELDAKFVFTHVVVEYQWSKNAYTTCVLNQVIYHFSDKNVGTISPKMKLKHYFHDDFKIDVIRRSYKDDYSANKQHSYKNFLYWVQTNPTKCVLFEKMKKKDLKDIADCFMQLYALIHPVTT